MIRKKILFVILISCFTINFNILVKANSINSNTNINNTVSSYTTLRDIDKWTFNEYRYNIVKEYFKLKQEFEISWNISKNSLNVILQNAKTGYNYLPDNLINENALRNLETSIKKWMNTPNSEVVYREIVETLNNYLEKVNIQSLKWNIEAWPITWNAPLTVTFRRKVTDPTWTIIPANNYIWWFDDWGKKKIIWRWVSINYTFKDEWNHTVFLDVKSSHKNSWWYTDVLPFSTRTVIEVKEKIASLIININGISLK